MVDKNSQLNAVAYSVMLAIPLADSNGAKTLNVAEFMKGRFTSPHPRLRAHGTRNFHVMHRAKNDSHSQSVANGTPYRRFRNQRPQ
jgi:hypothetical protein